MTWFKEDSSNVLLNIYVVPRSSKTEVIGEYNGYLKIKLKSPPVDNAANEELIRFLSGKLGIPKRNVEIVKGQAQRKKIVSVVNFDIKDVTCKLYMC